MNAKARAARQIRKTRATEARNTRRSHTLASHGRLAGLTASDASSIGGALRAKGKVCGVTGTAARLFRRNAAGQKLWRQPVAGARRYTTAEFAILAGAYNPRAPRLVEARKTLLAYATA